MWKRSLLATIAALGLIQAAHAMKIIDQDENALEASASDVQLPTQLDRSVYVKTCDSCPGVMLQLTRSALFLVNNETVDYTEFRALARANYETLMMVFYSQANQTVNRLTMNGIDRKNTRGRSSDDQDGDSDTGPRKPGSNSGSR